MSLAKPLIQYQTLVNWFEEITSDQVNETIYSEGEYYFRSCRNVSKKNIKL